MRLVGRRRMYQEILQLRKSDLRWFWRSGIVAASMGFRHLVVYFEVERSLYMGIMMPSLAPIYLRQHSHRALVLPC